VHDLCRGVKLSTSLMRILEWYPKIRMFFLYELIYMLVRAQERLTIPTSLQVESVGDDAWRRMHGELGASLTWDAAPHPTLDDLFPGVRPEVPDQDAMDQGDAPYPPTHSAPGGSAPPPQ